MLAEPLARFAMPGSDVTFEVSMTKPREVVYRVRPCAEAVGYTAEFKEEAREASAVRTCRLVVHVPRSASMA